jgi:hypothetical protein
MEALSSRPQRSKAMATNTKPATDGMSGKMAVLERRLDHLNRRLEKGDYANTASADFDRAEMAALTTALQCMRYVLTQ